MIKHHNIFKWYCAKCNINKLWHTAQAFAVDGVTPSADRVLVKDQMPAQNGIYVVTTVDGSSN